MRRIITPITAAAACAAMAAPSQAAEIQIAVSGPVVELSVNESVSADPDIVDLSAGVTTRAQTAVAAMQANATQMTRVIERIEALGVDRDDIQTSGISLNPQYDYDQPNRRQVFVGYEVSNRVSVTLRDIQRTGEVLDALVEAGATDLGGINWGIDDLTEARTQARAAAVRTAQARASEYAQMAGYSGVRLLEISEAVFNTPQPMKIVATAARAEMADATPVRPGQVEADVTVTVKYEMTR